MFSTLRSSVSTFVDENPEIAGIAATCAGLWLATSLYKTYKHSALHIEEKEETTNMDYPRARRLAMAKAFHPSFENCDIDEGYERMPDGNLIFTRCYIPKNKDKIAGMICYVHGYNDNLDNTLYDIAIEWCVNRNFIFFSHENYGMGRSDGLFCYCNDFNKYIKHSSYLHKKMKLKYSKLYNIPKNSYFLGGISLGGAIIIHQIIYEKEENTYNNNNKEQQNEQNIRWNGMFLAAPMCEIDKTILPPYWIQKLFEHLIVPLFPKLEATPSKLLLPFLLSENANKDQRYKVYSGINPLAENRKPRFITAKSFMNATTFIENNAYKIDIPLIIIHSKIDKVTNPQGSKNFYNNVSSKDKTLIFYDKGFHMIWSDVDAPKAFNDVEKWMLERIHKAN